MLKDSIGGGSNGDILDVNIFGLRGTIILVSLSSTLEKVSKNRHETCFSVQTGDAEEGSAQERCLPQAEVKHLDEGVGFVDIHTRALEGECSLLFSATCYMLFSPC